MSYSVDGFLFEEGKVGYFDLEERTFIFAKLVRKIIKSLPKTISNIEDARQVVRSSGSIGANYIEANESLDEKDFQYRIKICRKEAKESAFWIRLIIESNEMDDNSFKEAMSEAVELKKIFSSILKRTTNKS